MPLGTIVGGVTSLIGSGLSYKGQKDTNKTNIQLAKEGREHDENMWNKQNAYNTPEMQMQRLKEAGLNPNLMYGNGQSSTGNADAPKPAHVATTSNALASFNNNNAIQMLGAYQDWQVKKAQIKNIEEETAGKQIQNQLQTHYLPYGEDIANATAYRTQGQSELTRYQARALAQQYRENIATQQDRMALHGSRLNESRERTSLLQRSIQQKDLQIQLDQQLKPYGMSTADELWQRKLVPLIEDLLSPQKWIKNKFQK